MSRLIDADELKDALEKEWDHNDSDDFANKRVWHVLEDAPTIEPQLWIPVGVSLPEERQRCLVTYSGDLVGIAVFTNDLYRFDRDDFMGKKGVSGFVYYDSEYGGYFNFEEVTAWMPLPEPYRSGA